MGRKERAVRIQLAALLVACAVGCGGDDGPDTDDTPLGEITVALDTYWFTVRIEEALAGNAVADAVLAAVPEADLVLINGGSLRFDEATRLDGIYPPGVWTEGMLREFLRFDFLPDEPNRLVLITVTGAQLQAAFERSVSAMFEVNPDMEQTEQARGWFLQVAGATYRADLARQAQVVSDDFDRVLIDGERILEVTVAGQPIEPAATYRVVTTSFLADGLDGHISLAEGVDRADASDSSAGYFRAYLIANTPLTPVLDGRIEIVHSEK